MHTYTWFLFIGLTLAGALIAFMGDRLGRYLGKRRVTLFGLRPRHTALVFTVFAGMVISVTSLVAMAKTSSAVFKAVFEVENLDKQQKELRSANNSLRADNSRLVGQNHSLSFQTEKLQADHDKWEQAARVAEGQARISRKKLDATLASLEHARLEARRLAGQVASRNRELQSKSVQIASLNTRITKGEQELKRAQGELSEKQKALETAEAQRSDAEIRYRQVDEGYRRMLGNYNRLSNDLKGAKEELAAAKESLATTKADLEARRRDLETARTAVADAQKERDAARSQVASLREEQNALREEKTRLADAVTGLKAEMAQLEKDKDLFQKISQMLTERKVIFPVFTTLASAVIDGRQSPERVRTRLSELVAQARSAATNAGAGSADSPPLLLARIVHTGGGSQLVTDDDAVSAAAGEITSARGSVVARITVACNVAAGMPVPSYIEVLENKLVYHRGDQIAQRALKARLSIGQAMAELARLLQNDVRPSAIAKGMIPRLDSAGGPQLGEVSYEELAAVAEQVSRQRAGAVVQVVAADDLWSADPMKMSFRVLPAGADPSRSGGHSGIVETFR